MPQGVVELDRAIKAGDVKTATTKDLFAAAERGLSDDQRLSARLQSTFRAQEKLAAIPPVKIMEEGLVETGRRIGELLKKESAPAALNQIKTAPLAPTM